MQAKEKGSRKFNKGHQELPVRKSYSPYSPLQDQSKKSSLLWRNVISLVVMSMEGSPPAVLVSTALQRPPWTATEMLKPQVCLEGSFSLGVFGRLLSLVVPGPLCV